MGPGWILDTVISGMQTGVDQVALEIAKHLGYKTGGTCPKGFRTDDGPRPELARLYGVQEHRVSREYAPRTRENVRNSDATVIFVSDKSWSPGCRLTQRCCWELGRPHLVNPSVSELQDFILKGGFRVLNVAGNRLRTHPESTARARVVLTSGLLPF